MRWWLLIAGWMALTGLGGGRAAQAQSADSLRAGAADPGQMVVPVPAQGVVYLRMGSPGGVRIRSRHGTPRTRREAAGAASSAAPTPAAAVSPPAGAGPVAADTVARRGLTEEEAERLERRIDAIEDRLLDEVDDLFWQILREVTYPAAPAPARVYVRQTGAVPPATTAEPTPPPADSLAAPAAAVPPTTERLPAPVLPRTPEALPQTPPAVAPIVREVERAILETGLFRTVDVLFETDQATLLPPSQRTLDAIGAVLEKYPDLRIEVGGHADSRGPAEYNLRLSEARAAAVRDYLLERFPGIDPGRITARGYGEARPIASNDTETGRALNRRVEFVVVGEGDAGSE
ncbi:hypothetical protein AWN76_016975 [Rhodothermaceae bacterium RA]|nr:hypothetical protein AWN76_016975 [Rhodothermaceae bacterium RA]